MNKFFNKTLSKFEEVDLSYSVIIMAILLIFGVFMRTVMNSSLTFSEEIATALLILVSFFGLVYCARKGRHITMSIVLALLEPGDLVIEVNLSDWGHGCVKSHLSISSINITVTNYHYIDREVNFHFLKCTPTNCITI